MVTTFQNVQIMTWILWKIFIVDIAALREFHALLLLDANKSTRDKFGRDKSFCTFDTPNNPFLLHFQERIFENFRNLYFWYICNFFRKITKKICETSLLFQISKNSYYS